jgi:hypothetical protein
MARSKTKRVRRSLHLVDVGDPDPSRSLKVIDALAAIAEGNAQLLARYLREAHSVDRAVIGSIAFMLDPVGDRRLDYASSFPALWRLKFEHAGRGNWQHPFKVFVINWLIGSHIDALIRKGEKAEAAKQDAIDKFGISLRQANKALRIARQPVPGRVALQLLREPHV